jgi:hypothetical protein
LKYFVLLTPASLVVANLEPEALDVYEIDVTNKSLNLLQRLLLPKITGDEAVYQHALLRSHPSPLSLRTTQTPPGPVSVHTQLPFTTDETDGIIVCTFWSGMSTFNLVTHRSSLLHPYDMDAPLQTTAHGQSFRLIPWSDWGPSNCRSLRLLNPLNWICYVHGHRFATLELRIIKAEERSRPVDDHKQKNGPLVKKALSAIRRRINRTLKRKEKTKTSDEALDLVPPEEEDSEGEDLTPGTTGFYALKVFDFNPRNIRTAKANGIPTIQPDALSKERVNSGQLLVEEPSLLQDVIPTALPYLETTVRLKDIGLDRKKKRVEGVMMNGECVIFVTVRYVIVICPCAHPQLIVLQADGWPDIKGIEICNV